MKSSIKSAVFLGDSITMGYGLDNQSDRFSTVFCKKFGLIEKNYGITGTLMARSGTSKTNGSAYIDRFSFMEDGDLVVVFGGTNDYFWADYPMETTNDDENRSYESAVKSLCDGIKSKYPTQPIVFILPYQMRGIGNYYDGENGQAHREHNSDEKNFVGHTLLDYVTLQKEICRKAEIRYIDLYHDFGIDIAHCDEDFIKYTIDGCHPNANGHKRIADFLGDFCLSHSIVEEK